MNLEEFHDYCLQKPGATNAIPFPNLLQTLVFKVKGKMFAATNIDTFASFSIKCDPNEIDDLRSRYPAMVDPSYF